MSCVDITDSFAYTVDCCLGMFHPHLHGHPIIPGYWTMHRVVSTQGGFYCSINWKIKNKMQRIIFLDSPFLKHIP